MHIMILHFFWLKSNVMLAFSQNMKFYEKYIRAEI